MQENFSFFVKQLDIIDQMLTLMTLCGRRCVQNYNLVLHKTESCQQAVKSHTLVYKIHFKALAFLTRTRNILGGFLESVAKAKHYRGLTPIQSKRTICLEACG